MGEIIQKDLIRLDMNKINFDDKESVKSLLITLLNVVEQLLQENQQLRAEVQQLRDENARLKGEKGKPKIAPNVPLREPKLLPAEKSKKWSKDSKKLRIKIDRVVSLKINPETLPPDAVRKGYSSIVIQNIRLQTDNVEYRREHYYSSSLKQDPNNPNLANYDSSEFIEGSGSLTGYKNSASATLLTGATSTVWDNKSDALKALGTTTEANAAFAKAKELGYMNKSQLPSSVCNL